MKVITAEVTDGKVQLPSVPDGTIVAVLAPGDGGFRLTATDEAELEEALAEIHRGDYVDGHVLLAELKTALR